MCVCVCVLCSLLLPLSLLVRVGPGGMEYVASLT